MSNNNHLFAKRMERFNTSGIRKMFDMALRLDNPINLSIGYPCFDVPKSIQEATTQAIAEGFNGYTVTSGNHELIEMIKNRLEKTRNVQLENANITITSGVTGGIFLILSALCDEQDEVLIADPYFVLYKHLGQFLGIKMVLLDNYPNYNYDIEALRALITPKTKCILINTPSNPTGKVLSLGDIDAIVQVAKEHDLYIVTDEIYHSFLYEDFGSDNDSYPLPTPFGSYEKVVLLDGFSKSHGVTGWRLGYACGPSLVIEQMKKLQQYTYVCPPSPLQHGILKAYCDEVQSELSEHIKNHKKKRDYLYEMLSPYYEFNKSEGAFYSFIKCPWGTGESFCEAAIQKKLLLVPGNVFSEKDTHFRLSFSNTDEKLEQGIKILIELAKKNNVK